MNVIPSLITGSLLHVELEPYRDRSVQLLHNLYKISRSNNIRN